MPKTKPLCDVGHPPAPLPGLNPPLLLAHRHAQTIVSSLPLCSRAWRRRAAGLRAVARSEVLALEDGVRLQGYFVPATDASKGLVVLLHGWEGHADSRYLLSMALTLREAGYATFRLNLRDHGGTHDLNEDLFHSCRIGEVVEAVAHLQCRYSPHRLSLVGYSLGGNFALRVGARAKEAGIDLGRIVSVCPVLHPPHTMHALETGLWAYRRYYLQKWRRSLLAKQASFPHRYRLGNLRRFKTLTATTEFFVREYTEFADLDTYLHGYSILGAALDALQVPSRVIAAADDPIIPSADLRELAPNPNVELSVLPWGGHCGFVTDYRLTSRIDRIVVEELDRSTQARVPGASL